MSKEGDGYGKIESRLGISAEGVLLGEPEDTIFGSTGMTVGVFPDELGVQNYILERHGFIVEDRVVIKWPGGGDSEYFETVGKKANESIAWETEVDLRQEDVGMPASLGLVEVRKTEEGIMIFPANQESEVVGMLMPYYSLKFREIQRNGWSEEMQKNIMRKAIEKILAMQLDVQLPEDESVVGITKGLVEITSDRALNWYMPEEDESYGNKVKKLLIEKLDELLKDGDFVEVLENSGLKDCHGDSRLRDNGYLVVNKESQIEPIIADPVRLWLKEEEKWSDYHITPEAFDIGLALARFYTDSKQIHLFEAGLEEYKTLGKIRSEAEEKLLDLGLCYGVMVEILVLKNQLKANGLGTEERIDDGPTVNEYWGKINELVENNFMERK